MNEYPFNAFTKTCYQIKKLNYKVFVDPPSFMVH